jgi:hypothetical protein
MEIEDLKTTVSILKSMKDYQKIAFFESKDGKDFVKSLLMESVSTTIDSNQRASLNALIKAVGGVELEKNIVLGESGFSIPIQLEVPEDRTKEMATYPDKRLNSDHVLRAIGAKVLDPQMHWTKQSDLCHMFHASAESIEAAVFGHVGEGRLAYEKLSDQMIFART